ncbi:uncharacterized protein PRCAT00005100001 [Priceomyces carsonii]|uniref:uncharacterized protein n=1 Tax=Priceomyces carsonii TaxID=28549 RepID=UPI002ED9C757|nr:unnamed protein product [Priceomyces carsonii]
MFGLSPWSPICFGLSLQGVFLFKHRSQALFSPLDFTHRHLDTIHDWQADWHLGALFLLKPPFSFVCSLDSKFSLPHISAFICLFKRSFLPKPFPQVLQINGFSCLCDRI